MERISLGALARRHPWSVSFTTGTVIVESLLAVLYPLLIGRALDDLVAGRHDGLLQLAGLGAATAAIGTLRRYADTRIYASVLHRNLVRLTESRIARGAPVSRVAAHAHLFEEFVDFLEDAVPEVLGATVALVAILVLVAGLDVDVFLGCVALLALFAFVYGMGAGRIITLNRRMNDEYENQVASLSDGRRRRIFVHFGRMTQWRIRLSDLETGQFLALWIGSVALIVYTPLVAVDGTPFEYGVVLALVLYVLEFVDGLVELPVHVQQVMRLRDISRRLSADVPEAVPSEPDGR